MRWLIRIIVFVFFFIPHFSFAIEISEVMYDVPGSDADREWIEVYNDSQNEIDLKNIKLFENDTNHALAAFRGGLILKAGSYAVICDDCNKFITDWPSVEAMLVDSSFSLNNTGETLKLKLGDSFVALFTYSNNMGASGDGKTLQKSSNGIAAHDASPGQALVSSNENNNTSGSTNSSRTEDNDSEQQNNATQSSSGSTPHFVSKISARMKSDDVMQTGAESIFEGEAWGLKNEPISNARFLWNFGDGFVKEGKRVLHSYSNVGNYIAVLEVASGEYSASDRKSIKVVSAELSLDRNLEKGAAVSIKNSSSFDLNISGFILSDGKTTFVFPMNTYLKASNQSTFDNKILAISTTSALQLMSSNGGIMATFDPNKKIIIDSKPIETGSKSIPKISKAIKNEKITNKDAEGEVKDIGLIASVLKAGTPDMNETQSKNIEDSGAIWKWIMLLIGLVGAACAFVWRLANDSKTRNVESAASNSGADQFKITEIE